MGVCIKKQVVLVCCLTVIAGFSINSNSKLLSENGLMMEDHYDCLVKLFMGEHTARRKLQQQGNKQQQSQLQLSQGSEEVNSIGNSNIDERLAKLEETYNSLIRNQESLKNELLTAVNQSKELENQLILKLSLLDEKDEKLKVSVFGLENMHSYYAGNTSHQLELMMKRQKELEIELSNTSTPVGFTAFGTSGGTKLSGTVLKFPDIKSSFGLTQLSTFKNTGIWSCEKSGLYLVSVMVMSCKVDGDSVFRIYRNKTAEGEIYIGGGSGRGINYCNSGSGTVVLQLSSKDTVYIKTERSSMEVYDKWSMLTILKIG